MAAGPPDRVEVLPQAGVKGQIAKDGMYKGETAEVARGEEGEYREADLGRKGEKGGKGWGGGGGGRDDMWSAFDGW